MKNIALIFLVFIYAFSTTGISVKEFYCCGKLQSVKLALADYAKGQDGCCKTKYQSFKIKDNHMAADQVAAPSLPCIHACSFHSDIETPFLASAQTVVENNDHAPPLHMGVPLYISNSIYRN